MVDPIRSTSAHDATSMDDGVATPRVPKKLVDASTIAERLETALDVLERVRQKADARQCVAKDGPLEVGRMHAADPPTPVQAELDAFLRGSVGTYRAEGRSVDVVAFFRMNGGSHAIDETTAKTRDAVLWRAGLGSTAKLVAVGRGTPEQVRAATQALIDAGKLEPGPAETLCDRVRSTMWKYGIGIDCAGYARLAFLACRHGEPTTYGFRQADFEDLQNLATNRAFAKVDPIRAKPGDLFILGRPATPPKEPGHCLVVYSHTIADDRAKELLVARCGSQATAFIRASGSLHVYQVDASWGAGPNGAAYGGVGRHTWLYDESSKQWARYDPVLAAAGGSGFRTEASPCDHPILGVFRPKDEP